MKTPTPGQLYWASGKPTFWWTLVTTLIGPLIAVIVCDPALESLSKPGAMWPFLKAVGWATALCFMVGMLIGIFVLGPMYHHQSLLNGGPFVVGDTVQILNGRHRGRVGRIYSEWQQGQVRVDLGEEEKKRCRDIFSPSQLLREAPEAISGSSTSTS
jgi:hypothetical protein